MKLWSWMSKEERSDNQKKQAMDYSVNQIESWDANNILLEYLSSCEHSFFHSSWTKLILFSTLVFIL